MEIDAGRDPKHKIRPQSHLIMYMANLQTLPRGRPNWKINFRLCSSLGASRFISCFEQKLSSIHFVYNLQGWDRLIEKSRAQKPNRINHWRVLTEIK